MVLQGWGARVCAVRKSRTRAREPGMLAVGRCETVCLGWGSKVTAHQNLSVNFVTFIFNTGARAVESRLFYIETM